MKKESVRCLPFDKTLINKEIIIFFRNLSCQFLPVSGKRLHMSNASYANQIFKKIELLLSQFSSIWSLNTRNRQNQAIWDTLYTTGHPVYGYIRNVLVIRQCTHFSKYF